MRLFEAKEINLIKKQVDEDFLLTRDNTNNLTTEISDFLSSIQSTSEKSVNNITILADMLTDIYCLNSYAKNIKYVSSLDVLGNSNLEIDKNNDTIKLAKKSIKDIQIDSSNSSLSSTTSYKILDTVGNNSSINDCIKYTTPVKIEFALYPNSFKLNLKTNSISILNQVAFKLNTKTKFLPTLEAIYYINKQGIKESCYNVTTKGQSFNLDLNRTKDNKYEFEISQIDTDNITLEFSNTKSSVFELEEIRLNLIDYYETGFAVFGPIYSLKPILKCGLDTLTSSSTTLFSVSIDNELWTEITPANSLSKITKKLLSFNTKNKESLKTEKDVKALYLKIEMVAIKVSKDTKKKILIGSDQKPYDNILESIDSKSYSTYTKKINNVKYGSERYVNNTQISTRILKTCEKIIVDNDIKALGLISTDVSINQSKNTVSNFYVENKLLRLPAGDYTDADKFDISDFKLYNIYVRQFKEKVNVTEINIFCIPLLCKEDVYTISSTTSKLELDVTCPFIKNSLNTIIIVPEENIRIHNIIGTFEKIILKENLLKKKINNIDYFYVDLIGILYKEIKIKNKKLNNFYPILPLQIDEFALQDGNLISDSSILDVDVFKIVKRELTTVKNISYENGNYLNTPTENYSYYKSQVDISENTRNVLKLDCVSIEKGTVKIYNVTDDNNSEIPNTESEDKYINVGTEQNPVLLLVDNNNTEYLER